jgi:dipeptidyl-peptidase-4
MGKMGNKRKIVGLPNLGKYRADFRTRSLMVRATIALFLLAGTPSLEAKDDPARLTLERIITDNEFRTEGFGPARWLKDGTGYTTLERAQGGHGRDLIKSNPADGRREILVPAEKLRPAAGLEPLGIDDYAWSDDGSRLLIFTNTRRVWRLNTRGD